MESLKKVRRKRGRPQLENKKVHPPRIVIREKTVKKIKEIAQQKGVSQSEIYQMALDYYIESLESMVLK